MTAPIQSRATPADTRPGPRALLVSAVLLLLSAWAFAELVEAVLAQELGRLDGTVYRLLQAQRSAGLDAWLVGITELGDAVVVLPVAGAALAWLVWRRQRRAALYLLAAVAFAELAVPFVKLVLQVPRPVAVYTGVNAYSFPSGHAARAVLVYGFLAFLGGRGCPRALRLGLAVGTAALAGLIAFSRAYLGAHWLSDILGGAMLAAAWLLLLTMLYRRWPPATATRGLLPVLLGALLLSGGWHIARQHAADLQRYAPQQFPSHAGGAAPASPAGTMTRSAAGRTR